jgi:glycosyltransferase involved in cell wall biosynthesis
MKPSALILVLNQFTHDSRVLREVNTLADNGWEVNVFALHEADLPLKEVRSACRLRRFRLWTRPWPKLSVIQAIKYLECILRMTVVGLRLRATVVHANDLNTLPIGFLISYLTGAKLIYDAHELWSDPNKLHKLPPWMSKVGCQTETWLAQRADAILTVSGSIARHMSENMRIPPPAVIRNIPGLAANQQTGKPVSSLRGRACLPPEMPVILHLGLLTPGRGLETLLLAMQRVKSAVVVFLGDGPSLPLLKIRAQALGLLDRAVFLPPVPPEQVSHFAREATLGVALIEAGCLSYQYCLPNKLFEYIQAGLPVVVSNLPEMAALVKLYDIGATFTAGDPDELAIVLNKILCSPESLAHYRRKVTEAADELNWEKEHLKLLAVYSRLGPPQLHRVTGLESIGGVAVPKVK